MTMKKFFLIISTIFIYQISIAQISDIKYYKDINLNKEVTEGKGNYLLEQTINPDQSETVSILRLKDSAIIYKHTVKDGEPIGWVKVDGDSIDYNFDYKYSEDEEKCSYPIFELRNWNLFSDHEDINYTAPLLENNSDPIKFINNHLTYPDYFRKSGYRGVVVIMFTLNKEGNTENITVKKGSLKWFDKEAVRIINMLHFSEPAKIENSPIDLCFTITLYFNPKRK